MFLSLLLFQIKAPYLFPGMALEFPYEGTMDDSQEAWGTPAVEKMLHHQVGLTSWSGVGRPLRAVLLSSEPRPEENQGGFLPMPMMGSIASDSRQMRGLHKLSLNPGPRESKGWLRLGEHCQEEPGGEQRPGVLDGK